MLAIAQARTLQVGVGGYTDLATAIDASDPGDTIVVLPGTWALDEVTIPHDLTVEAAGATFTGPAENVALNIAAGATVTLDGGEYLAPLFARGELHVEDAVFSLYGTIYADEGAVVDIVDCNFSGIEVDSWGAALAIYDSALTVTNSVFSDNVGTGAGAVYVTDGSATFTGVTFVDNRCDDNGCSGGAITGMRSQIEVVEVEFLDNEADGMGGAISTDYCDAVIVRDSVFRGNDAPSFGAMDIAGWGTEDLRLEITGSTFTDNSATNATGGVYAVSIGEVIIRDTVFEGQNGMWGAALWVWSAGRVELSGLTVTRHPDAVAMLIDDAGDVSVTDSTFTAFDTALSISRVDDVTLRDNLFTDGDYQAVGVNGFDALTSVRDRFCRIGNVADGGALGLLDGDEADIRNALFDLVDGFDGGAVRTTGVRTTVRNSDFLGSSGRYGAAIYTEGGSLLFTDNLVVGSTGAPAVWSDGTTTDLRYDAWFNNADGDVGGDLTAITGPGHVTTDPGLVGWVPGGCVIPARGGALIGAGSGGENLDGSDADIGATGGPDAAPTAWDDGDGDGAVAAHDCDDTDDARAPGNVETCDDIDEDCDGVVDSPVPAGAPTWYRDTDGDGHGDPARTATACDTDGLTGRWVAVGDDCDPSDGDVWPGAPEACDGLDNDCDGDIDEDAVGGPPWYLDVDGDGYGVGDDAVGSCAPLPGRAAAPGDCDDADGDVHPGVDELCDGVDNDCDGEADNRAADAVSWYKDEDGDGFGRGRAVEACDPPEGHAPVDGDCDDDDDDVYPGAPEACDAGAVDANCDGSTGDMDADEDGSPACEDCDDTNAGVRPGAPDTWYDGVDQDCSGTSDFDADGDGEAATPWGEDCDDTTADVGPDMAEIADDGVDQDCDGEDEITPEPTDVEEPEPTDDDDDLEVGAGCACDAASTAGAPVAALAALALSLRRRRR